MINQFSECSGVITLAQSLDFETSERHHFNVIANISSVISYASVIVRVTDVNDNRPTFTSSTFTKFIEGDANVGSIVDVIEATDADVGSTLVYSIANGNDEGYFSIDNNGIVKFLKVSQEVKSRVIYSSQQPRRQTMPTIYILFEK